MLKGSGGAVAGRFGKLVAAHGLLALACFAQAGASAEETADCAAKISAVCKVTGCDTWYGHRRVKFDFQGRSAWVVEPSVRPEKGCPWTWTMQWAEAYVERTGVPAMLALGWHHATIDLFDTRMDDKGVEIAAAFQKFLVETLGFDAKACLIGPSWGGFFSTRYAGLHPENVAKIYLDAPLLTFDGFRPHEEDRERLSRIGSWAALEPKDHVWTPLPAMPINFAETIAKAGIPILLVYGGQDQTVDPSRNCEPFAARFEKAGGKVKTVCRSFYGHHPHGLEHGDTAIVSFLTGTDAGAREKIFCVVAHPDDMIACAGTMLLLKDKFEIHEFVLTHGERGLGEKGFRDGTTKAIRTAEEENAAAMLGAKLYWGDEIDGEAFAGREPCEKLAELLKATLPRAVFAMSPLERHPDHAMSSAVAQKAIHLAGMRDKLEVYFMEEAYDSRSFHPVHTVDITEVLDQKRAYIRKSVSQNANDQMCRDEILDSLMRGQRSATWVHHPHGKVPEINGEVRISAAERFAARDGLPQGARCLFAEMALPKGGWNQSWNERARDW